VAPDLKLGAWYNRLTHMSFGMVPRLLFGSVVSQWRRETLKLPARSLFASDLVRADGGYVPVLMGFSPNVVRPPMDWPQAVRVTGYWFLDEGETWESPSSLLEFLADGGALSCPARLGTYTSRSMFLMTVCCRRSSRPFTMEGPVQPPQDCGQANRQ
jgi:hypothetical protein